MQKKAKKLIVAAISLIVACAILIPTTSVRTVANDETIVEGFYGFDLSSAGDVTVQALASEGQITERTLDSGMTLYEGSNQLSVTVPSAQDGSQYVVILTSSSELPVDTDKILYMDQKAGEGNNLVFLVYPAKLDKTMELSLFVTSNDADFDTKVIRLGYYAEQEPTPGKPGWQQVGDKWYYCKDNGEFAKGWLKSGSTWYYMDPTTGVMQTGLVTVGSAKYYMDPSSGAMKTGWISDNGTWYYAQSSGALATGWLQSGSTWYYMDPTTCAMKTGWVKDGGKWYFMKDSGAMATGWVKSGNDWYYMNASGVMTTGWVKVGSSWYFMKASGPMAANEWCSGYWLNANGTWTYPYKASWKQDSKGWWFGDTSGWYAKSTTQKIDNVNYTFDAAGYWVQ